MEIQKVEDFLKLPKFYSEKNFVFPNKGSKSKFPCYITAEEKTVCMKKDKGRDHPKLKDETLHQLQNYFRSMVEEFHSLTGLKLSMDQEEL